MRKISEIKPFEDEFELFEMPDVKLVGRSVHSGGEEGNQAERLWNEMMDNGQYKELIALPGVIENCLFGWITDMEEDNEYRYLLCAMLPADAEVPQGYEVLEIPGGIVAKGKYSDELTDTIALAKEAGYEPCWKPFTWNAEMFLKAEDEQTADSNLMPRHWLVPVKAL